MVLNKNQKTVFYVALGIIFIMGIFPPWIKTMNITTKTLQSNFSKEYTEGYHFIFVPPDQSGYTDADGTLTTYAASLDYGRLFLQWLLVIVISGGLIFLFREPQKNP